MKGQRSAWPLVLIYNQCFIRFNIFRKYYDFRLNSYRKKNISSLFQYRINALGIKFGLAVKKVKVNPGSSFVQIL